MAVKQYFYLRTLFFCDLNLKIIILYLSILLHYYINYINTININFAFNSESKCEWRNKELHY
jgi:hypothetical protein